MNKNDNLELLRLYEVIESLDVGVIIRNAEDKVIFVNNKFIDMFKLTISKDDFNYLNQQEFIKLIQRFSKDEDIVAKNINKSFIKKDINKGFILELKDGKTIKQSYMPIQVDGEFIGESLIYEDITEKVYLQTKVLEFSINDNLTKIYNRKKIKDEIRKFIELSKRYEKKLAIAIFDIDNFKNINKIYGQEVGDNILVKISDVVNRRKRAVDTFGRWGGGEFIIILPETDLSGAKTFAEYLKSKIAEIILDEKEGRITVSFGLAIYIDNETIDQFMHRAYVALDKSKKDGKNKVTFYEMIESENS